MRIAVFSDIHGNLEAFQACLEDARKRKPDLMVMLGDYVNGAPNPKECWELAKGEGDIVLKGNHERYLFDFNTPREMPDWQTQWFTPMRWSARNFTQADFDTMAALPMSWHTEECGGLEFVHSSLISDNYTPWPSLTKDDYQKHFAPSKAPYIIRGHNHIFISFEMGGKRIDQIGSVGFPLDGRIEAEYALLEGDPQKGWKMEPRFIPYDVESMLARFHSSGLYDLSWMSKLYYLELQTGKPIFFSVLNPLPQEGRRGRIKPGAGL
ncbi:MAG: metallophosphoesterase [Anaerolineaceae bacterium]|nr:metallophosphoesterase [Anaerolineaceae bacterium]